VIYGLVQDRHCSGDRSGARRASSQWDFPTRAPVENAWSDYCHGTGHEMPSAAGFCHSGPERLGTTVPARACSVDSVRRLNLLQKQSLPCYLRGRRPGQRSREIIARGGSNGNFFECFYCQMAMPAGYPKPGLLAVYDTVSTPRGLPFRLIRCHSRFLKRTKSQRPSPTQFARSPLRCGSGRPAGERTGRSHRRARRRGSAAIARS
jgi:hypothetical protein